MRPVPLFPFIIMHSSLLFNASKDASWVNARRLQQHHKKLQEIRSRSVQALPTTSLRHSLKGISYLEAERLYTIKRDNRLLMKKLVSIAESKGDRSKPGLGVLRSMNLAVRKREDDRIRAENYNFGKRLVHIEGSPTKGSVPNHHYSKSSAFRSPNKALFKVTAMVASESRLNSTVIEEGKPRLRGKVELNRSLVDLRKGQSGITLAEYLDAKGDIAIIADIKSVKKKGNAVEMKPVPKGNASKSVSKLEIVKLPVCDLKAIPQVTASKPLLYAFPIANEAIPPLPLFPAVPSSQHSTPVPTHSSKARLQRQETIHGASPHSLYSQSLAGGLQSASLSKQVSVASQELGELEEQYSEDAYHEEESEESLRDSQKSGIIASGIEENKAIIREKDDKNGLIAHEIEEKKDTPREKGHTDTPKDEGYIEFQEVHTELHQLPTFTAEKSTEKDEFYEPKAVEIADFPIKQAENTEIPTISPSPIEGNQPLTAEIPLISPNQPIKETFSRLQSPRSPQIGEIKAEKAVNSPKEEEFMQVLEGNDDLVKDLPENVREIEHISQIIRPIREFIPAETVFKGVFRSKSALIAYKSPFSAENHDKKARNHSISHWTVPNPPISTLIMPEEMVNLIDKAQSSSPIVIPAPSDTEIEPISLFPASISTNSHPVDADKAVKPTVKALLVDFQQAESPKSPLNPLIPA